MGITEKKEKEKDQRKNDIIDAAEKVFFSKGIENSTMEEVANKAGISKGTIYLYFKNKQDLHFAICIRGMDVLSDFITESYSKLRSGIENILEIGRKYIQFSNQYPDYFNTMMVFNSSNLEHFDPLKKSEIIEPGSPLIELINVVEKGKMDGSIRNDIASEELAIVLWSQLTGVIQFLKCQPEILNILGINSQDFFTSHFKIIRNGVISNQKAV